MPNAVAATATVLQSDRTLYHRLAAPQMETDSPTFELDMTKVRALWRSATQWSIKFECIDLTHRAGQELIYNKAR